MTWSKSISCAALMVYIACLFWLIIGAFIRFRHVGKVCAGDFTEELGIVWGREPYQWQSGRFMKVYILLVGGVISTLATCGCVCCTCIYCWLIRDYLQ